MQNGLPQEVVYHSPLGKKLTKVYFPRMEKIVKM